MTNRSIFLIAITLSLSLSLTIVSAQPAAAAAAAAAETTAIIIHPLGSTTIIPLAPSQPTSYMAIQIFPSVNCDGASILISAGDGINTPVAGGMRSYILSRDLMANEALDWSTNGPNGARWDIQGADASCSQFSFRASGSQRQKGGCVTPESQANCFRLTGGLW